MQKTYTNDCEIVKSLCEKDPLLTPIFAKTKKVEFETASDYFRSLVSAIVAQQLSGKVADAIYRKIVNHFAGDLSAGNLAQTPIETLRSLGLSYRKAEYIQSLANNVLDSTVSFQAVSEMTDTEIIDTLIKIRGIGKWSAEMFLIFSLGRENIFSVGDYGLRRALSVVYGKELSAKEADEISDKWSPYKSVVSLFLWSYVD